MQQTTQVNSLDILNVAKICLSIGDESGYRSCVSRAYYSMYHETMSSLAYVPHFSSNHHKNLIGYMVTTSEHKAEPFDSRKLKILGYCLKQQRDARNDADYDLTGLTVSEEMANDVIESADIFFSEWNELKAVERHNLKK